MNLDLTRRGFMAGLCAATAEIALTPTGAIAGDANPTYRSASDLRQALAARQISSRELVDAAITRIEALDPKINAVVVRDFDRARMAADTADAALGRGERRPLLGLPMTVKEQFNVAGLPTTWGYRRFRDWRPDVDALAVQRLKAAGAIIIGKTNVPEGLSDWQSYNEVYGATNNPWNLGRTPGGSSGGAAAALAAGFVPLELGADTGGSLRIPAHFCGVFGHKPSLNLIPQRGSGAPQTPAMVARSELSVIGPMARSADDLALELSVLAGPDKMWDGIGYELALPEPRHDRLADFRVLLIDEHPLCPTAVSVRTALEELTQHLVKLGCTVVRASPKMPDLEESTRTYIKFRWAYFGTDRSPDERALLDATAKALAINDQSLMASGLRSTTMSFPAWVQTSHVRDQLRAQWQALFQEVDVVLCPPMPTTAFPHDHSPLLTRRLDVDGKKIPYYDQIAWSTVATLTGLPATIAPISHDENGLPIGVQIIGGYLNDRTTIAFAGLLEREFGGFTRPPNL
jgi:amidase